MRNYGFTLAEVLITLGIIGVVAAMTIPTLITNYQKHSYYTQFMKARSVIENALRLYANDHDCQTNEPLCNPEKDVVEEFSRYFKGATLITDDNAKNICKGYDKLPVKDYKAKDRDKNYGGSQEECGISNYLFGNKYSGFITIDGLLLILNTDVGAGACSTVDVNGPDSGPNIEGRDVFSICLVEGQYEEYCGNIWGFTKECIIKNFGIESGISNCFGIGTGGDSGVTCGARLIKEGKMTY